MFFPLMFLILTAQEAPQVRPAWNDRLIEAAKIAGLTFTEKEAGAMRRGVRRNLQGYRRLQAVDLPNDVPPALRFSLLGTASPRAAGLPQKTEPVRLPDVKRPDDLEDLAFAGIPVLASLIRSKKVSCLELTRMYLGRLKRLDPKLACVITFTEERATERAKTLDQELAAGTWRGLLHGIPYGAKDLLAVKGYRTTWGAKPFEKQILDLDATVIRKLDAAGAVLIAKLTLGALAMGDVWYGGKTRNPWNPEQGSSGSSAGSAAATAAGGVAFAIGSETYGSIISPSSRCGCSSLRPTFGRVSRHGAMALSWSMDKLGPLCRTLEDAGIVFAAIHGSDGKDETAVDMPFEAPGRADVRGVKVGYLARAKERSASYRKVLDELKALEVELVPIELPDYPLRDMLIILHAEAAAAFDGLTRSDRDEELVRQDPGAWPNLFRVARLIPAVEYIRANRIRTLAMRDMHVVMQKIDAYVHLPFGGRSLALTNLTGHPAVIAPCGFRDNGTPTSICFTGRLFGETRLLALAQAWQRSTGYHRKHPAVGE